jgi:hypothetical protein
LLRISRAAERRAQKADFKPRSSEIRFAHKRSAPAQLGPRCGAYLEQLNSQCQIPAQTTVQSVATLRRTERHRIEDIDVAEDPRPDTEVNKGRRGASCCGPSEEGRCGGYCGIVADGFLGRNLREHYWSLYTQSRDPTAYKVHSPC